MDKRDSWSQMLLFQNAKITFDCAIDSEISVPKERTTITVHLWSFTVLRRAESVLQGEGCPSGGKRSRWLTGTDFDLNNSKLKQAGVRQDFRYCKPGQKFLGHFANPCSKLRTVNTRIKVPVIFCFKSMSFLYIGCVVGNQLGEVLKTASGNVEQYLLKICCNEWMIDFNRSNYHIKHWSNYCTMNKLNHIQIHYNM